METRVRQEKMRISRLPQSPAPAMTLSDLGGNENGGTYQQLGIALRVPRATAPSELSTADLAFLKAHTLLPSNSPECEDILFRLRIAVPRLKTIDLSKSTRVWTLTSTENVQVE